MLCNTYDIKKCNAKLLMGLYVNKDVFVFFK